MTTKLGFFASAFSALASLGTTHPDIPSEAAAAPQALIKSRRLILDFMERRPPIRLG